MHQASLLRSSRKACALLYSVLSLLVSRRSSKQVTIQQAIYVLDLLSDNFNPGSEIGWRSSKHSGEMQQNRTHTKLRVVLTSQSDYSHAPNDSVVNQNGVLSITTNFSYFDRAPIIEVFTHQNIFFFWKCFIDELFYLIEKNVGLIRCTLKYFKIKTRKEMRVNCCKACLQKLSLSSQ